MALLQVLQYPETAMTLSSLTVVNLTTVRFQALRAERLKSKTFTL